MENKKSFGNFILQRRKELGMTQKEFAQRLFVTDSAVSKWERGLAYPDITLLQSICEILQCSEKELLSSSEDTEGRRAEQLAKKYLRLTHRYRLIQFLLYGGTLLACAVGNLATTHTLSWFWIVLTSLMMVASLALLPVLVSEKNAGLYSLGSFTLSLLLLFLSCALYTGGTWFPIAASGVLFGMGLVFLPYVLRHLSLPPSLAGRKALLYVVIQLLLLFLLFGVCCVSSGASWFLSACLWTAFGVTLVSLPFLMKEVPLPILWTYHKALIYFSFETLLLLLGLLWEGRGGSFPLPMLPCALLCLALPWGWMACVRYLPLSLWFRLGIGFLWSAAWLWLLPWGIDRILLVAGEAAPPLYGLSIPFDLLHWTDPNLIANNVLFLILMALAGLGLGFLVAGFRRRSA